MKKDCSGGGSNSDDDDDDDGMTCLDNSELWSNICQWRDTNILNDRHVEEIFYDDDQFSSPIRKPSSTSTSSGHPARTSSKGLMGLKPVPGLTELSASASATSTSSSNSQSHRHTKNGDNNTTTVAAANSKSKSSSPNLLSRNAIAEFIERCQLEREKVLPDIDDPNRNDEYFLSARENSSSRRRQRTFKMNGIPTSTIAELELLKDGCT
jgi:hypothetical protein